MTLYGALKSVNATLNEITVSGKDNLDKLLGCIQVVEKICTELEGVTAENDGNGERQDSNG